MARPDTPYGADHATDLSPPAAREEVHNRRISCNGFVREDGHYDIEAEITDNKTYSCLLYTSPSPRDRQKSRMPSSA